MKKPMLIELKLSNRDWSELIEYSNQLDLSINAFVRKLVQKELLSKTLEKEKFEC